MRGVAATAAPATPAATSSLRRLSSRLNPVSCPVMAVASLPGYLQDKLDRRSRTNSSLTELRPRSLLWRFCHLGAAYAQSGSVRWGQDMMAPSMTVATGPRAGRQKGLAFL